MSLENYMVSPEELEHLRAVPAAVHEFLPLAHEKERAERSVKLGENGERCVGQPIYFYYESTDSLAVKSIKKQVAKMLCESCTFKNNCLETAMAGQEEDGIWGGLTPAERKDLRFKRMIENKRNQPR